jgi:hypothetical protein
MSQMRSFACGGLPTANGGGRAFVSDKLSNFTPSRFLSKRSKSIGATFRFGSSDCVEESVRSLEEIGITEQNFPVGQGQLGPQQDWSQKSNAIAGAFAVKFTGAVEGSPKSEATIRSWRNKTSRRIT